MGPSPRKPPRLHQSREVMELTPQETTVVGVGPGMSGGESFITTSSPEAQHYGQSYGITPGTPV